MRPLIVIAVNGVLSRLVTPTDASDRGWSVTSVPLPPGNRWGQWPMILDRADRGRVRLLSELGDVVACSSLGEDTGHVLGRILVNVPVVVMPQGAVSKLPTIRKAACGRPVIWVDPYVADADERALLRDGGRVLRTDPRVGLTALAVAQVRVLADDLSSPGRAV